MPCMMDAWQTGDRSKRTHQSSPRVRSRFDAGTNKTIATLRKDGSPRISASELTFTDGAVTLGMMSGSMKLLDVRRDPRIAIHSPTIEPPAGALSAAPGDPNWLELWSKLRRLPTIPSRVPGSSGLISPRWR